MRSFFYSNDLDRQRMAKFFAVGATGVVVNLAAMAGVIAAAGWQDWRASVLASLIATLNNYVWNNFWTFRDRVRTGWQLFTGYGRFLVASTGGLIVTTAVFAILRKLSEMYVAHVGRASALPSWSMVGLQGVAILFGAFSNYRLNGLITWKAAPRIRMVPVKAADEEPVSVSAGSRLR